VYFGALQALLVETRDAYMALCSAAREEVRVRSGRSLRFFDCASSLWLESSEEHLPTSIAGVLRLRAMSRPLHDRSARRFAQDDDFAWG
jgi:hypothetical protein